jgi:hypothetical protein
MIAYLNLLTSTLAHACGSPMPSMGIFGADCGAQSNVATLQDCCDFCANSTNPVPCAAAVYDSAHTVCYYKDATWRQHLVTSPASSTVITSSATPPTPTPPPKPPTPTPPPKPPTPTPPSPGPPSPASISSIAIARPCGSDGGATMKWQTAGRVAGATNVTLALQDYTLSLCIDGGAPPMANASEVRSQNCNGGTSQSWDIRSDWRITQHGDNSMCLTAANCTYAAIAVELIAMPCDPSNANQVFSVDAATSTLRVPAVANQYSVPGVDDSCIAVSGIDCDNQILAAANGKSALLQVWCDATKDATTRATALVAQMTMREKLANLGTGGSMNPGLSVARGPWWGEALHGLEEQCGAGYPWPEFGGANSTGCPTSFPHGTALGATFNRSLWQAVGNALAAESRGLNNQGIGPIWYFSPADVNLARDPRWGRGQEVASEDPFLNGEFGILLTGHLEKPTAPSAGGRGARASAAAGAASQYRSAISCTKHFAAYDCENCAPCDYKTMDSYYNYTTDPDQLYCDRQHFDALIPDQVRLLLWQRIDCTQYGVCTHIIAG